MRLGLSLTSVVSCLICRLTDASECSWKNLTVIRNIKTLSLSEKHLLVEAMHQMKRIPSQYDPGTNAWDYFVSLHKCAVVPNTEEHEGWRFFPFHREMINRFTKELQRAAGNDTLWFPYWDFTSNESTATLMSLDYIGGKGEYIDGYVLREGNFAKAKWQLHANLSSLPGEKQHSALLRCPGNGLQMCLDGAGRHFFLDAPYNAPDVDKHGSVGPFAFLPADGPPSTEEYYLVPEVQNLKCDWTDLSCMRHYRNESANLTLRCKHYAAELPVPADYSRCFDRYMPYSSKPLGNRSANPWDTTYDYFKSMNTYFRPCFEGIDPSDEFARGVERLGASLHPPHGSTHSYMGCSVATPTSPNDPIFIHLHWNVDRLWAEYQSRHGGDAFFYENQHLLDQEIPGFPGVTTRTVLDYEQNYGYTFDTLCDGHTDGFLV